MKRKELLQYAIKGLNVEIAEYENKIDKGYAVIDKINRNVAPPTAKSKEEITEKIKEYQQKRAEILKKRDVLLFDEMMAETDEATERREQHLIKIALSSILSDDVRHLGNLTLEDIAKLLNKIVLRPYCERIGKRYDELTEEDKQIIADMQLDDYITAGEKRAEEIQEGYDNE
jgi:DNA-directed RNA polymerase